MLTSDANGNASWQTPSGGGGGGTAVTAAAFSGFAGSSIASGSTAYVFAGPTTTVTITSTTQRIVASASANLGMTTGSTTADIGICYQLGAGTITNFAGINYITVALNSTTTGTVSADGSITGLAPGTYTIGLGVRNSGAGAINSNDYVNGWVTVIGN